MKTINFNDINLKTIIIAKTDDGASVEIIYNLIDTEQNYQGMDKRITIDELTAGQITKIRDIVSVIKTKLKNKELK